MPSPSSIREVRAIVSTTFKTTMLNAGEDGPWNVSSPEVHKIRPTAVDTSGLTQSGITDETLQTRMHAMPPMIAGLAKGTTKVTCYAGGAYSNTETPPEWNIASACAGGIAVPTTRSDAATAAVSSTNVGVLGVGALGVRRGMAVLCGVRGDGKGSGEVKPINAVTTDNLELSISTIGPVDSGDNVVFSTTIYPDEDAVQKYVDLLMLGHAEADQIQAIGAAGPFTFSGMSIGELPKIDFDLAAVDWQYQPPGSRASLQYGEPAQGGNPAFDRGVGLLHIGDRNSTDRTSYKISDFTFDPGLSYEEIPDINGVNGAGGHQHMPGIPRMEFTILSGEDDGLLDDFPDTEKSAMVQFGHTPTKCIAFEMQKCYVMEKPQRVEINNLTGWRIMLQGNEEYVPGDDLQSAVWRIHIF